MSAAAPPSAFSPTGTGWRAISLLQPWLHLITHAPVAPKRIENRSRRIVNYREYPHRRVYLHAGKRDDTAEWDVARAMIRNAIPELLDWFLALDRRNLPRGGVVASCRILGMVTPGGMINLDPSPPNQPLPELPDRRWHIRPQHGYILGDVQLTPFAGCPGALGFFELPQAAVNLLST